MKTILQWFSILLILLIVWSVGIEPRLIDIKSYQVELPNLPPEWEEKKIAVIGDFQYGMWLGNPDTTERVIEKLIDEKPAAVLITGDFIYHPTEEDSKAEARSEFDREEANEIHGLKNRIVETLRPLVSAGIPTYAVLGNHDYAMETPRALKLKWVAMELKDALAKVGVEVLENEAVKMLPSEIKSNRQIAASGSELYLVGIGPHYPNKDHVMTALSKLPENAPRVFFMHNPQSFPKIPSGEAPLAIAGHTHGGQIRIPSLPSWSWLKIVKPYEIHADGWIQNFGEKGNQLYVNRGIGFSRFPVRLNCPPELTYFILQRKVAGWE